MQQTRIDSQKLKEAVTQATQHVNQAFAVLLPFLVILTDKERQETPKPRDGFFEAGRSLARALTLNPAIGAVAGCDPAALVEDLENAEAISPVAERMEELSRRIADSRLTWLAEAWEPALTAYAVAKVLARKDGKVREVVDPLAAVFTARRTCKPAEPKQ